MGELRLFDPVFEPATKPPVRYLAQARTAVRRARERALTAVPEPSFPGVRSPGTSRSLSHQPRTIGAMPRGRVADPPAPHGTRARYNHRSTPCRCAACRLANRTYMAQYRTGERPGSVSVAGAVDQPVSRRYL